MAVSHLKFVMPGAPITKADGTKARIYATANDPQELLEAAADGVAPIQACKADANLSFVLPLPNTAQYSHTMALSTLLRHLSPHSIGCDSSITGTELVYGFLYCVTAVRAMLLDNDAAETVMVEFLPASNASASTVYAAMRFTVFVSRFRLASDARNEVVSILSQRFEQHMSNEKDTERSTMSTRFDLGKKLATHLLHSCVVPEHVILLCYRLWDKHPSMWKFFDCGGLDGTGSRVMKVVRSILSADGDYYRGFMSVMNNVLNLGGLGSSSGSGAYGFGRKSASRSPSSMGEDTIWHTGDMGLFPGFAALHPAHPRSQGADVPVMACLNAYMTALGLPECNSRDYCSDSVVNYLADLPITRAAGYVFSAYSLGKLTVVPSCANTKWTVQAEDPLVRNGTVSEDHLHSVRAPYTSEAPHMVVAVGSLDDVFKPCILQSKLNLATLGSPDLFRRLVIGGHISKVPKVVLRSWNDIVRSYIRALNAIPADLEKILRSHPTARAIFLCQMDTLSVWNHIKRTSARVPSLLKQRYVLDVNVITADPCAPWAGDRFAGLPSTATVLALIDKGSSGGKPVCLCVCSNRVSHQCVCVCVCQQRKRRCPRSSWPWDR